MVNLDRPSASLTLRQVPSSFNIMKRFGSLAFLLATASRVAAEGDVIALTKDNFSDYIRENDLVLAECKFLQTKAIPVKRLCGCFFTFPES